MPQDKCRICGCTQAHACPGGCGWAKDKELPKAAGLICTQCCDFRKEVAAFLDRSAVSTKAAWARLFHEALETL